MQASAPEVQPLSSARSSASARTSGGAPCISTLAKIMQRPTRKAARCLVQQVAADLRRRRAARERMALTSREAARSPAAPAAPDVRSARMPTSTSSPAGVSPGPTTHSPLHGAGEFCVRAAQCAQSLRRPCGRIRARPGFAPQCSTVASRAARPIAGRAQRFGAQRDAVRQSMIMRPMPTYPALTLTRIAVCTLNLAVAVSEPNTERAVRSRRAEYRPQFPSRGAD